MLLLQREGKPIDDAAQGVCVCVCVCVGGGGGGVHMFEEMWRVTVLMTRG